ncbi:MAG: extracellular solute-binding protein [Salinigranum sp.]
MEGDDRRSPHASRRRFLAVGGAAALAAVAGCTGGPGGGGGANSGTKTGTAGANGSGGTAAGDVELADFRGSGPLVSSRPPLSGTRMDDLPPLSGDLTIYLGGGEGGLYLDLLDLLNRKYPDFHPTPRAEPSAQLANTLIEETRGGRKSPADVFWAVDAGSLGVVADNDVTAKLPSDVTDAVPKNFRPGDQWVGVAGRARSVPYNTDHFSKSDVPTSIDAFPGDDAFAGVMGWAPTYGAFQAFVTAMRVLEGEAKTKQWLNGMQAQKVSEYHDEFLVSNAVADGEVFAGFANHYYALRVKASRPDAPIDLAFTSNDAGALIDVAGAAVVEGTEKADLATNFVHHLLTAEAQEFFATRTFAYPTVEGVPPVGGLPPIDELNPPDMDLAKLSDVKPTLGLMREAGVL